MRHPGHDKNYAARLGLSVPEYLRFLEDKTAPVAKFRIARSGAHRRGVEWRLTIREWWEIWQASGKWESRGRGQGYCMCRRGDEGPYEAGNVFIAPVRENSSLTKRKRLNLPMGVKRHKRKFMAHRTLNGKWHYIGLFNSAEEAHAAYLSARCTSSRLADAEQAG